MQEDKTCQEQETSVGVGGEGQSEGAGQVKGQYRAYPVLVYGTMFFFAQRRDFFAKTTPRHIVRVFHIVRHAWGGVGVGWGKNVHVALPMYVLPRHPWGGLGLGSGKNSHVTLPLYVLLCLAWGGVGVGRGKNIHVTLHMYVLPRHAWGGV